MYLLFAIEIGSLMIGILSLIALYVCIFIYCKRTYWRERNNNIQIVPIVEPTIMVNPMRIKQEKIMRMI